MEMEEDTIIAIGFVVGAVLLVVVILIWVIIYCLRCRKREEASSDTTEKPRKQPAERFRYLSSLSNQKNDSHAEGSISASSSRSGTSYQRELPQLPHNVNHTDGQGMVVMTPDFCENAKPKGVVNQSFISSVDGVYAYCDDIPRYPAPAAPQGQSQPDHQHQPSNELLFLERKYNIKADDTDNIHNSRPLTCYSNSSSAYSPANGENSENYADVNNLLRSFSILSPDESDGVRKEQCFYNDAHNSRELNQNQNANLSDFSSCNPQQSTGNDTVPLAIGQEESTTIKVDSRSTTLEQRSQLKEIEEISFDTQNIPPEHALVMDPPVIEVAENMTYFSKLELSKGRNYGSTKLESDSRCVPEFTSQHGTQSIEANTPKSILSGKPIPKPRHSRSASMDTLASQNDIAADACNDYTNIPPLPMPRSSQPAN